MRFDETLGSSKPFFALAETAVKENKLLQTLDFFCTSRFYSIMFVNACGMTGRGISLCFPPPQHSASDSVFSRKATHNAHVIQCSCWKGREKVNVKRYSGWCEQNLLKTLLSVADAA